MADTLTSAGTCAVAASLDPVQLQMQAVNGLSRCRAMLLAEFPMHLWALEELDKAREAITALQALEAGQVH